MQPPHEEKPEGAPEWMVSYADMITIIMSFFVIMFAVASGEAAKGKKAQQPAIESLQYRFGPKWKPFMSWGMFSGNSSLPGRGKGQGSPEPTPAVGDPGGTVHVAKREKARIRVDGQGDLLAIGKPIRFDLATTDVLPDQDDTVRQIAEELRGRPQRVVIEAKVSNHPLPPGCSFHDRWELGFARCRKTAALFTSSKIDKLDPERFRLSVQPASAAENNGENSSDADFAVQVYADQKLPTSAK
jgi:chemotaxis protein MotB